MLEVVTKYSSKEFHELKIYWKSSSESFARMEIFLEELEPIFLSWANRQKSLSLIITVRYSELKVEKESMKMIEKFKRLGIIKKFEIVKR